MLISGFRSMASAAPRPIPILLITASLLLLALAERATAAGPQFDSWTTENGLPQNSVNDILQTRDGYLWLATHGGLVRFDGVRFVVFDTERRRDRQPADPSVARGPATARSGPRPKTAC